MQMWVGDEESKREDSWELLWNRRIAKRCLDCFNMSLSNLVCYVCVCCAAQTENSAVFEVPAIIQDILDVHEPKM